MNERRLAGDSFCRSTSSLCPVDSSRVCLASFPPSTYGMLSQQYNISSSERYLYADKLRTSSSHVPCMYVYMYVNVCMYVSVYVWTRVCVCYVFSSQVPVFAWAVRFIAVTVFRAPPDLVPLAVEYFSLSFSQWRYVHPIPIPHRAVPSFLRHSASSSSSSFEPPASSTAFPGDFSQVFGQMLT